MRNKLYTGLIALALAAGWYLLHRLGLRGGATDQEVHSPLPGDDLVPNATLETTHAVTIGAPPASVWPWLVQMGYRRAGWYTDSWYYWVDKYLFRIERPASADRILPQWQGLKVGDAVPDDPTGVTRFTVAALEPERALVLYSTTHLTRIVPRSLQNNAKLGLYGDFSWAFVLDGHESGVSSTSSTSSTRLILRARADCGPRLFALFNSLFLPPADFVIVRLMLQTIKQRVEEEEAERSKRSRALSEVTV